MRTIFVQIFKHFDENFVQFLRQSLEKIMNNCLKNICDYWYRYTKVVPMKPGQRFVQAQNALYRNSIKTGVFSSSFQVDRTSWLPSQCPGPSGIGALANAFLGLGRAKNHGAPNPDYMDDGWTSECCALPTIAALSMWYVGEHYLGER